jgi:hypothetical protein
VPRTMHLNPVHLNPVHAMGGVAAWLRLLGPGGVRSCTLAEGGLGAPAPGWLGAGPSRLMLVNELIGLLVHPGREGGCSDLGHLGQPIYAGATFAQVLQRTLLEWACEGRPCAAQPVPHLAGSDYYRAPYWTHCEGFMLAGHWPCRAVILTLGVLLCTRLARLMRGSGSAEPRSCSLCAQSKLNALPF